MGKYIDTEKLIAEIKIFRAIEYKGNTLGDDVANCALDYVLEEIIPFLLQEQPEVDLEKELCEYFEGWRIDYYSETEELLKNNGCTVDLDDVKEIARHFYELGLSARKES